VNPLTDRRPPPRPTDARILISDATAVETEGPAQAARKSTSWGKGPKTEQVAIYEAMEPLFRAYFPGNRRGYRYFAGRHPAVRAARQQATAAFGQGCLEPRGKPSKLQRAAEHSHANPPPADGTEYGRCRQIAVLRRDFAMCGAQAGQSIRWKLFAIERKSYACSD